MDPVLIWFGQQILLPMLVERARHALSSTDWPERLARSATRATKLRRARRAVERWLRTPETQDLLIAPSPESAAALPESLKNSLQRSLVYMLLTRPTDEALASDAQALASEVVAAFLVELEPSQAIAIADLRNSIRFEELIHRLDADVDVGAVARLPPSCRSWVQELLRSSRATGGQLLRLLTHRDTDPSRDVASLISDPPAWLLQAGSAAWITLGEFLVSYRIFGEGGKAFEIAAAQGVPDSGRWRIRAAFVALQADDAPRALELCEDIPQSDSSWGKGVCLVAAEDWAAVRELPEQPIGTHPEDVPLYLALKAEAEDRADARPRAVAFLERAVDLQPGWSGLAIALARSLAHRAHDSASPTRLSDLSRARALSLRARDQRRQWGGNSSEAVALLCDVAGVRGDYAEGIRVGRIPPEGDATPEEATDPDVLASVARLALGAGERDLARSLIDHITDEFERAWFSGTLAEGDGDAAASVAHFQNAYSLADSEERKIVAMQALAAAGVWPVPGLDELREDRPDLASEMEAVARMARGEPEAAIALLRPLAQASRRAARVLVQAHKQAGERDQALQVAKDLGFRFSDPELLKSACQLLVNEGLWTQAESLAQEVISRVPSLAPGEMGAFRELIMDSAAQRIDWRTVENQATLCLDGGYSPSSVKWTLIGALWNLGRAQESWEAFERTRRPTPESEQEVVLAIELYRRFSTAPSDVMVVLDFADSHRDSEEIRAAALIAAYTMSRSSTLPQEDVTRLHESTEGFLADFPASPYFRRYQFTTPEEFLEQVGGLLRTGSEDYADAVQKALRGSLPSGFLAALAGKPYGEALLRRAPGCLPIAPPELQVLEQQQEHYRAAHDATVVVEPSALHLSSLLPTLADSVSGHAARLEFLDCCLRDLQHTTDSLSSRSTATVGWDPDADRPAFSEISQDQADDLADRAAWMLGRARVMELVQWEDFRAIPGPQEPRMCPWLGPLDRAKSLGLILYTDDVALMALAREFGIPHFGSWSVLRALSEDGRLTDAAFEEAVDLLTSNYCVDWPGQLESVRRVAEQASWQPGAASYALTRPSAWSAPIKTLAVLCEVLSHITEDEEGTFAWFALAATGLARVALPERAAEAIGQMMIEVSSTLNLGPAALPTLLRAGRIAIDQAERTGDPLEFFARSLLRTLSERQDRGQTTQLLLHYVAALDPADRLRVVEITLDPREEH